MLSLRPADQAIPKPAPRKSHYQPCFEALEDRRLMAVNLALNPLRTGFPHPAESDRGWGGGADRWDIVDGAHSYSTWARGLAFTGGPDGWAGEPGGTRQATINLGTEQTFDKVTVWWHGVSYTPSVTNLQRWTGSGWAPISATRTYGRLYEEGSGSGYAHSDEYSFAAVSGSKVRLVINDLAPAIDGSRMVHGWIYEFEVFAPESTPSRADDVLVNDGSAQRSGVYNLWVGFSGVVTVSPGAFEVRTSSGSMVGMDVHTDVYDGRTWSLLVFTGSQVEGWSLRDGNYTLTVRGDRVQGPGGLALDGDGDGTAGGHRVERFHRLFGDSDGDRDVDAADFFAFLSTYRRNLDEPEYLWWFDYDADGSVGSSADAGAFISRYGTTLAP